MKKIWYVQTRGAYNSDCLGMLHNWFTPAKAVFGTKANAQNACERYWDPSSKPTPKQGVLLTAEEYKLLVDAIDNIKDLAWNMPNEF